MSNQIFKKELPNKIIFDFLDKYALKDNTKYYLVTKESFKSANFHNEVEKFCKNIEEYYFNCKKQRYNFRRRWSCDGRWN